MNIGGGEAADQLVRMMLSGSEVAVRLSGSAIKNVLALTMALAKKHKTISGKVNLAKMLKETRDVRRFAMSPEQYQQFRQRAGKQKILFSAIRDSDSGSDDTEIADDPGIFIPLQLIVQLQLRRLMLIFKNAQRNADQIGNF